jgi:hypothetical protein
LLRCLSNALQRCGDGLLRDRGWCVWRRHGGLRNAGRHSRLQCQPGHVHGQLHVVLFDPPVLKNLSPFVHGMGSEPLSILSVEKNKSGPNSLVVAMTYKWSIFHQKQHLWFGLCRFLANTTAGVRTACCFVVVFVLFIHPDKQLMRHFIIISSHKLLVVVVGWGTNIMCGYRWGLNASRLMVVVVLIELLFPVVAATRLAIHSPVAGPNKIPQQECPVAM